jgi:hypothetical protein
MKPPMIAALIVLSGCQLGREEAVAASPCPIDKAVYAQQDNKGVTAGFGMQRERSNYASDLVFYVRKANKTYWFGFSMPNGYGGPYIHRQIDPKLVKPGKDGETPDDSLAGDGSNSDGSPGGEMNWDAFDAKLVNLDAVPQSKDPAPAYFFSAELGPHFWYGANGGLYQGDPSVGVTRQLWRLTGCDKDAH